MNGIRHEWTVLYWHECHVKLQTKSFQWNKGCEQLANDRSENEKNLEVSQSRKAETHKEEGLSIQL